MSQPTNRRDFLKGKSTVRAIHDAVNQFSFEPSAAVTGQSEARQAAYLEEYSKSAMACQFQLLFNLHQHPSSAAGTMRAFELIDALEAQLTVYRDDSEVSRLNATAFDDPIRVEAGLFELLQLAQKIHTQTGGAFDITSGELTAVWGFEQRNGAVPGDEKIAETLACVGMKHLAFGETDQSIQLLDSRTKINLGGIGKGYAIDRVASLLSSMQVDDFVIHGGQSSVYAKGHQKRVPDEAPESGATESVEHGWPIGLSHPSFPDRRLAQFQLFDSALGTSGTGRQGFFHQGKRYGHIIDPRTGWPTDHHLSTTVIASSAAVADALATAFFVMSNEEVESYCRIHSDVAAVLVNPQPSSKEKVEIVWFNLPDDSWRRL